jgi:L-2-hydroxycarboxylate dehydrogenase (NAD+)
MEEKPNLRKETDSIRVTAAILRKFVAEIFQRFGVPQADANQAADVLCVADEWGIRSHGVARLRFYCEMLSQGRINPVAKPRIVRESASVVVMDADNGLGLVVAPEANRIAIERALTTGISTVSVLNSNHFGIAGYYVLQGLEEDLIRFAMTNTPALVAQLWGVDRMLGTNPIAAGFPAGKEPPVVIDMATSAISLGAVENARRDGTYLPIGCITDAVGNPSIDPHQLFSGGALTPLGGLRDTGGHKGYCLATLVDLLCGVLPGAGWGPFVPAFPMDVTQQLRSVGAGLGHLFGALSIRAFSDVTLFRERMDAWIKTMREGRPSPGCKGPLIPGDPEREAAENSRLHGIKLQMSVAGDLDRMAREHGLRFT